jgi:integrase
MSERAASETVSALLVSAWPAADRHAWEAACRPGERLKRGGAAAHMKPVTRADLAQRYGYFLDHLARHGKLRPDDTPAGQVTLENVTPYVVELQARVGSVTVYGSIYKLRRTAELLAPERDFLWLREIENDLDFVKVAKSKYPRLVMSSTLVDAGMSLFAKADESSAQREFRSAGNERRAEVRRARGAADRGELKDAVLARNGVMIALLAVCPIRLKNFAALQLGTSLQQIGDTWWVVVEPEDAKPGRADERPVPAFLVPLIERYLEHYRPLLGRGRLKPDAGAVWISSANGNAMRQSGVERTIRRTTGLSIGIEIGPHMFRTAAGTEAAIRAVGMPGLASALLQHRDPRVTEVHYNKATSHQAAQTYEELLERLRLPACPSGFPPF